MNPEVKVKWLAALRSGQYKQAIGALCRENGHCCLGVLCDIHAKETGSEWGGWMRIGGNSMKRSYLGGETSLLPDVVVRWAGLTSNSPAVYPDGKFDDLASVNDNGAEFPVIADLIEKHL